MKIISWNVNGVRAVIGKGLLDFIHSADADVICLQETKAQPDQLTHIEWPSAYQCYWNAAVKKGYSGTGILTRQKPVKVWDGLDIPEHDQEGRVQNVEFESFILVNVYTPNAQHALARLDYRLAWDAAFRQHVVKLQKIKPVMFCGDLNVAHKEIDLARPKENVKNPGFSPEERASFSQLVDAGFIDTFREFESGGGHYSWWSYRAGARARNVGWRIDYCCISPDLRARLQSAFILPEVTGSDHCPVGVTIQ
ncbi:MAG: exodeoxyribonuclease III [Verrucomicrobia bacterium]|jgi:exodeoxyribonuclease-3|nr:exodeoxyribonuclease III [Verrucomicrobiota bacterium]